MFGELKDHGELYGTPWDLSVVESSLASKGAHARVYNTPRNTFGGKLLPEHVQVNVAGAKALIEALQTFVREAESGMLTEPAVPREGRA